jgi:UDP-N-acetylmuramate dehydrogenase
MKDILSGVSMINGHGRVGFLERTALRFSYRNLEIPERSLITGADFRLAEGDRKTIEDRVSEILKTRGSKHPLQYRNAGSIFKNPPGMPAGRIIEEAGLKGLRMGDAEVSIQHGNFIVNRGRATAKDILLLVELVRQRVFEARGVSLEMEVKVIGDNE